MDSTNGVFRLFPDRGSLTTDCGGELVDGVEYLLYVFMRCLSEWGVLQVFRDGSRKTDAKGLESILRRSFRLAFAFDIE